MAAATRALTLIVDDDPAARAAIARALETRSIASIEAGSAGQALTLLEHDPVPTTIVLGLSLPDADGIVVLRRVRRDALPIRVAVLAGADDAGRDFDVVKPDRFFATPLDLPALLAWVGDESGRSGPG